MDFKAWRISHGLTLDAAARAIGITGANPGRTLQRIELGENRADADLIEAIERITERVVTATDMQSSRLSYLRRIGKARELDQPLTGGGVA